MKKYLSIATVLVFVFPIAVFASFDTDVHYGSTGPAVVSLQEFLIDQGLLKGQATGNFYSLTLKAVKAFQKAEGITPVSGYFGPITRGIANQVLSEQVPSSEGNATTTKPAVDLSQQQNQTAVSHSTVTTALQNQINALLAQLHALSDQVKTQTTTPQVQTAPAIQQNITPAVSVVVPPPATPTVASVPTIPTTPTVDLCANNIEGAQTAVPAGMTATGNVCIIAQVTPPPPTDLCPNITGVQTAVPVGMVLRNGNCVTPAPIPVSTTSLLLPKYLGFGYGGQTSSWPNGNNYGNINDSCSNCVALITEMPTTANIYLMEYTALRGGVALDGFADNNPQSISIYADNNLSTSHVFLFSHLGMDQTKKYSFIVDATDQSGNKYVQQFGGVDSNSTYLPGPFKWNEMQTISLMSDYPIQYMKSGYYVDVPLTKVQ